MNIFKTVLPAAAGLLILAGVNGCKPKNNQNMVSGDAAARTYVAPGQYD